ncbi:Pup--protein ligase [Georgenia sp. Z1344]|uniref:Pup--protein ligase n=1 Tax=Georgenia sp. Z1344 TaxID=3416706 RepID=UPI003CEF343F
MTPGGTPPADHPLRRLFGVETEYGLAFSPEDPAHVLGPDDTARHLFRPVVERGRSTNVFLRNGARLYLDVGSHPEYATAECDDVTDVVVNDRAGEAMLASLAERAEGALAAAGTPGTLHLMKNNLDSQGASYGCHENYLVRRRRDYRATAESLVTFFVTRQVLTGAGHLRRRPDGSVRWAFSQRADQTWDAVSAATTRSRPIINTRDEPHGDAELYRRMHVIVGDSNVAPTTTLLKVGSAELLIACVEDGLRLDDLELAEPMRAIREISHDIDARVEVELATGRRRTAVDLQSEMLTRVRDHVDRRGWAPLLSEGRLRALDLWERGIAALRAGDLTPVATELDVAAKRALIDRYCARNRVALDDPRVARLSLAYHDITAHGLGQRLLAGGLLAAVGTDEDVETAKEVPPSTTRAALRGRFVGAAEDARRDIAVDWVHLKLVDGAARSVALKDPFAAVDDRVDALLAELA